MRYAVALMPVDDEITSPVDTGMDRLRRERDIAKPQAKKFLHEFIVVARDVSDARLLATFAKQFLDEQIVFFTPKPFVLQLPAVNEVADDVKMLTLVDAEKVQERSHLGVFRAEMHVGNPYRTMAECLSRLWFLCHKNCALRYNPQFYCRHCNQISLNGKNVTRL